MKILLATIVFTISAISYSLSQTFEVKDYEGNIIHNGDNYMAQGGYSEQIEAGFIITSLNDNTLELKVKRYNLNICDSTSNTYCFGGCYVPNNDYLFEGDIIVTVNAGEECDHPLLGHYYSSNIDCCSNILYTIYNINNPDDSLSINVIYFIHSTDSCLLESKELNDEKLHANIYPNPGSGSFTIEVPDNNTQLNFSLYSIQGELLHQSYINGSAVDIDLEFLHQGIYIARIEGNKSVYTTRLIIR